MRRFDYYVRRFECLFYEDRARTEIHVMAGNHDIGFHYAITPYLDRRFREAFSTVAVQYKVIKGVPIVMTAQHGSRGGWVLPLCQGSAGPEEAEERTEE